ncbi:AraC family transcriptional regulator [Magnetospirillum sulfuroxidans]|uniref:AraC family transcriptional regulator n=1 Tax=Magnetospirillum sulfuroxidans TaxID=611300 RepID=A0ABS5IGT8_9PROT|nr:AraC family transcriptional regulator [Magnetospirillum sulfuroxidans]MBR9973646.1 AraC family transcriptional regulator [Magnetospirillum sulfuroxidans]
MNLLSQPRLDRLSALLSRFKLSVEVDFAGSMSLNRAVAGLIGQGGFHILRQGTIQLDRHPPITAPALILMPRQDAHRLRVAAGATAQLISGSLDFGPSDINPIIAALPNPAIIPMDHNLEATLLLLEQEAVAPRCGAQAILDRICEILLIQALRHLIASQSVQAGVLAALADERLARALAAIHTDPAAPWTLASLADLAGMSRTAFALTFHRRSGRTVGEYLAWWRTSLAKQLLEQGNSLKRVAGEVGYESTNALAQQMRRILGVGPREILRRQKLTPPPRAK